MASMSNVTVMSVPVFYGGAADEGKTPGNLSSNKLSEGEYHLAAASLLFIGTFGMFNNLLVMIVMAKKKQLRTPLNLLLLSLALSDLGISAVGSPLSLLAAVYRGWYLSDAVCVGYAFLMSFFGIASITTLTVLSFERYLMISSPWRRHELTYRGSSLLITATWTYALLATCPPLLGWGAFGIEGPGISCSVDWETRSWRNTSYIAFLFTLGLVVPLVVMGFSYINILLTLNQRGQVGLQSGVARAEKRVTIMVLVMVVTFLVAWTPYSAMALIMALGKPAMVPPAAAVAPAICAKSSCLYNPIIYVGLNTQFRSAWRSLFCCEEEDLNLIQGFTTEKVSLSVFSEHSPQSVRLLNKGRNGSQSLMSTEVTPLKDALLRPVCDVMVVMLSSDVRCDSV